MQMALAQINPLVGDFSHNVEKICARIADARSLGCDLVVFPELALVGYPPRDLLDKSGFVRHSLLHWRRIGEASRGMGVICGAVAENVTGKGKPYHNSALFFADGVLLAVAHKQLLPSYDVFDEERYFEPGDATVRVDFRGKRFGITICEDIWNVADFLPHFPYHRDPARDLEQAPVDVLINISASPYHARKVSWVSDLLRDRARSARMQVVYVNQVGGNDELIFQGHSMAWDEEGRLVASAADFTEDLVVYDTRTRSGELHAAEYDPVDEMIAALVFGLRDYARKCGFAEVVLGLSGGVDSALVASLAVLALGPERVLGVALPGPYNAPESLADARELARRLGIRIEEVPITPLFTAARETLAPIFKGLAEDATEENLQARLRGLILMAFSNKFQRLLLSTGNKSELAVGYCTLYGDMNGGLALVGDVPKTSVYALARRLAERYGWIPERILTRPPSAELRPNQTDQDSLPPYEILDPILAAYIEKRQDAEEIIAQGYDPDLVRWVMRKVDGNEYKRWQAPPVLRVTAKAFGTGRRFPIAHGYREGAE